MIKAIESDQIDSPLQTALSQLNPLFVHASVLQPLAIYKSLDPNLNNCIIILNSFNIVS